MIVKVQIAIVGKRSILMYGKDRFEGHVYQTTDKEEVEKVEKLLRGQPKGYFHATRNKEKYELGEEAEWQDW